ncbi:MAG: dihydropyrimidinase [Candidatus Riflebacteria bacterium]|nr:dihydropyrimidinase [Candidatus Riflebacteria bacterium]
MSILIKNGRIVTAVDDYRSDIFVESETITTIGIGLSMPADTVIDAHDRLVIPGGIDPHVHLDMPYGSICSTDDFETGTRAAAFGGTTTVIDFPTQVKGRSMLEALDLWHGKAQGRATIDYGFHMIVTDLPAERVTEMAKLVEAGISSFKLFMAYPGVLYLDDGVLFRAMRKAAAEGTLVLMHAENGIAIDEIVRGARAQGQTAPRYHPLTRPTRLEGEAVHRAIALAEVAGCPMYIVHLSSGDGLEQLRLARHRGLLAYGETCPQYLFLDKSLYEQEGAEGAKYMMTPSLREKWNQFPLWRGLASGDISVVGTDHCPFYFKGQKEPVAHDFTKIPNGAPGIENRMSLIHTGGVVGQRFGLNRFVQVTSTNAARMFGLFPRKGTIAVGSDADLVIFDPDRELTISVDNPLTHHMRVDYNAYEGISVRGYPETVVSRGRVICQKGEWLGKAGAGRFLKRRRFCPFDVQ